MKIFKKKPDEKLARERENWRAISYGKFENTREKFDEIDKKSARNFARKNRKSREKLFGNFAKKSLENREKSLQKNPKNLAQNFGKISEKISRENSFEIREKDFSKFSNSQNNRENLQKNSEIQNEILGKNRNEKIENPRKDPQENRAENSFKIYENYGKNSEKNLEKNAEKNSEKVWNDDFSREKNSEKNSEKNREKLTKNFAKNQNSREKSENFIKLNATFSTFHHDKNAELAREKTKKLRARRQKIGVLFVIIFALSALAMLVLWQFNGNLTDVKSSGVNLSASEKQNYEKIAGEYFAENPFERFDFARRADALKKFIEEKSPEIANVEIENSGIATGEINLTFRRPVAMWNAGNAKNYVDASGAIFQKNYFAEPSVQIFDDSGISPADGVAASARFLEFVGQVVAGLAKNNLTVEKVVIPRGAARYVEFYLAGRAYPFKAQIDRAAAGQAADIAAMANYLDARKISPSYVDVRVSGKGFWK